MWASLARWMCLAESGGSLMLDWLVNAVLALFTALSSTPAREADKMASWSGSVVATDAKKAERVRMHTLLTPTPLMWTCIDACFHCSSESWMLRMLSSAALSTLSNSSSIIIIFFSRLPAQSLQAKKLSYNGCCNGRSFGWKCA